MLKLYLQKPLHDRNYSMKRIVDRVHAIVLLFKLLWTSTRLPLQIQHTRSAEQRKNVVEICAPIGVCSAPVAMRTLFLRVL